MKSKSKAERFRPAIRTSRSYPTTSASTFTATKRDKRTIKSSVFRSKIEKASAKPSKKRKRPSRKLVTTLESLVDALPDVADTPADRKPNAGAHDRKSSLRSKPGARKVKERLVKEEQTRFAKNMAVMSQSVSAQDSNGVSTASKKWAALRQHLNNSIGLKGNSEG